MFHLGAWTLHLAFDSETMALSKRNACSHCKWEYVTSVSMGKNHTCKHRRLLSSRKQLATQHQHAQAELLDTWACTICNSHHCKGAFAISVYCSNCYTAAFATAINVTWTYWGQLCSTHFITAWSRTKSWQTRVAFPKCAGVDLA